MKSKLFRIFKTLLVVSAIGCVASVLWAGFHYLHTDPRFNVKLITVSGVKRVDEDAVRSCIKLNTGVDTNLFAVDMEDVRARVEQIQWVHYAIVQRILPDQIIIRVVEREPVGIAQIQGHIYEFDSEAVILEPDSATTPMQPILVGLQENDQAGNLKKIAMYTKVIADLGATGLSEIMVNHSNEVSVIWEQDTLVVNLGVDDFKQRWSNYLALKDTINTEYKDTVRVDLRFKNKVIVSRQGDDDGGKVIWDGKKKSL